MNMIFLGFVVILYLSVIAFLGYRGYKRTKSTSDYLLAGRKIHPMIMAISYGATFISTSAIVGFGGAAAVFGMGVLWLTVLNIFVGIFIAFVFFGLRTRKMGHNLDAHTFPELLGRRFDSRFLQTAGGLLIFLAMPLYAAAIILGGAQFMSTTLAIPYEVSLVVFVGIVAMYVIMGGMRGVMYTDAFQGTIMFVSMTILLVTIYSSTGGVVAAHTKLTALAPQAVNIWGGAGHQGWTAMPVFWSPLWQQLVTTIVLGVGIGVLAQPQLVVRFMTVKSGHELNRAVLAGGVFIMMMTGVAFVVGALANVYFFEQTGNIALLAAGKKTDAIIPLFIKDAMPWWFTSLFMITLLAAAMSTLSSQFHSMGSAFGRDFLEKGLKVKIKDSITVNKLAMIAAILFSTLLAFGLPLFYQEGTAIIATGTAIFFGLCASAFLPMFVGAFYFKRMSATAALASFWAGIGVSLFALIFIHIKESKPLGLCNFLFGTDTLIPVLQNLDPLIMALPVSVITAVVVTFFSKPPSQKVIDKAFKNINK
ncbi:MAG: sodium:solute symporter family protein [Spirochaetes bacterium]|nr:sodium:solute symporter family protein [Spirochaetota bacterium]MBN2770167.1 sodium:solute symporter family protein [Spirochaetota bacterium]